VSNNADASAERRAAALEQPSEGTFPADTLKACSAFVRQGGNSNRIKALGTALWKFLRSSTSIKKYRTDQPAGLDLRH